MTDTTELTVVSETTAAAIYAGGIDAALEKIATEARAQLVDISTKEGRTRCASLAYKVARSKTLIDETGKQLGEDARKQIEAINADRKKSREFLDALKDEVRKPLTDWEQMDADRIAHHEAELAVIIRAGTHTAQGWPTIPMEAMRDRLTEIEADAHNWEEFGLRAKTEIAIAHSLILDAIHKREKQDTEQAELTRLRKEESDRKKRERDEAIARQAAETARLEAERKAADDLAAQQRLAEQERQAAAHHAEQQRLQIEWEKQQVEQAERRAAQAEEATKRAEEKAEADRIFAEQKAVAEQQRAVEEERQRVAREAQLKTDDDAKREADTKHRAKVNNAAMIALRVLGLSEVDCKKIVTAIAKNEIPGVKIVY